MTNDELAAVILPWAKEHHPDKYEPTIAVSSRPHAFRRYLCRLIEIRWEEDHAWRSEAPLRALEETSITQRFRLRNGMCIEVKGSRAPGERVWTWNELAMIYDNGLNIEDVASLKQDWDLVVDDGQFGPARYVPPAREPEPAPAPEPERTTRSDHSQQTLLEI